MAGEQPTDRGTGPDEPTTRGPATALADPMARQVHELVTVLAFEDDPMSFLEALARLADRYERGARA